LVKEERNILYYTVAGKGEAELIIEKSRFIGHVFRIGSREEAESFFAEIRKNYRDASHNVPVFVIGKTMREEWANDDGEPSGTAGLPILQLLKNENISNTALMVTRYFGGVKLGKGGLKRAYTATAKATLAKAALLSVSEGKRLYFRASYQDFEKIRAYGRKSAFIPENISYAEDVSFEYIIKPEDAGSIEKLVSEISKGAAVLSGSEDELIFSEIDTF